MLKRGVIQRSALLSVALVLSIATPAMATEMPTREDMWKMLQQQQKEIEMLKSRLEKTPAEKETPGDVQWVGAHAKHHPVLRSMEKEEEGGPDLSWISIGGVVEVEANATDNADGNYVVNANADDASTVTLATVELSIGAAITELVHANVLLLHEDGGGTPINVDEATITIGNTEKYPIYLTAGRMAVPFGNFTTNLVSDPLTLVLAETKETVLQAGFEANGFYGSVYAFNGDANEANTDSTIEQLGANLGYATENNTLSLDVGLSFINSIEDSDSITGTLNDNHVVAGNPVAGHVTLMSDHVVGVGAYGILGYRGFKLIGEYVGAAEDFAFVELPWRVTEGARPAAWNGELGYTFDWSGKETTLAAAWQGTDEAWVLGLPENRYLAAISVGIFKNTMLSLEWFGDEDYEIGNGGTGNDANSGTAQLAVEF